MTMRELQEHACHAHGCSVQVPPELFMCRRHWYSLRKPLRVAIWREYRPGQEISKDPSPRYLAVQRLAIAEVAFKSHDEGAARIAAPYLLESERWRRYAIEAGYGDPLVGLVPRAPA